MPDELAPRRETIEGLSAEVKQLSRKVDQLADLVNTFLEKLPGNAPAPIAKRTEEEKAIAVPEYLVAGILAIVVTFEWPYLGMGFMYSRIMWKSPLCQSPNTRVM